MFCFDLRYLKKGVLRVKNMLGLFVLCCVLVSGCAYKEKEWVHPGKSLDEYGFDVRACQDEADRSSASYPPDFILEGAQNGVERVQRSDASFDRCMRDKGYRQE